MLGILDLRRAAYCCVYAWSANPSNLLIHTNSCVYEYQTPAQTSSYPQTPGVMGSGGYGTSESVFELSSKSLLKPELANKYGNPWHDGDCEKKQGVVLSMLGTQNDSFTFTAHVRFLELVNPLQPILTMPVSYLWPVHPESKGEDVIILSGSQSKG